MLHDGHDDVIKHALTRRQALRAAGGGVALLLPAAWLTACGGGASTASKSGGSPAASGTDEEIASMNWAQAYEVTSLNVADNVFVGGLALMSIAFEGLLTITDDFKLSPLLAESWDDSNPDRHVFTLRKDVTFWDGTPLTPDDVVHSMSRYMDAKGGSQLASYFGDVESVKATGPREVTIAMARPNPTVPSMLVISYITPKRFAERAGKKLGVPGPDPQVMGTGAYRVTGFDGDTVELERNPGYWGEQPRVQKATFKTITNPETTRLAMTSGDLDGTTSFPLQQARQWDRLPEVETLYAPGLSVNFFSFDMSAPPFDDIHVRRAIAHASDLEGYTKAFMSGRAQVAAAMPPPGQWAELLPADEVEAIYASLPKYPFDMAKAADELAQSQHAGGFTTEVTFPGSVPELGKVLVSLSESLKEIGVTLNVKEAPLAAWAERIYAHEDLGMNVFGLGSDYIDPVNSLTLMYPSGNAEPDSYNIANFKDPTVDRLIEEQAGVADKAKRAEMITEVLRISAEQLPYYPLWWEDAVAAVQSQFVWEGYNALYYQQNWLAKVKVRA